MKLISLPLTQSAIDGLKAGDRVLLSGSMLTGRDAAHKRLIQALEQSQPLPINISGETIYYVGPCPPKPNQAVGSCGPTTSSRMDTLTIPLLEHGLRGMVGKGNRCQKVKDAIVRNHCVYFVAIGGAAALYAKCVTTAKVLAYDDLGTEAIHHFIIQDFPVLVAIDCFGNSIFDAQTNNE